MIEAVFFQSQFPLKAGSWFRCSSGFAIIELQHLTSSGFAGMILQLSGQWFLNGQLGRYDFDDSTGWLSSRNELVGRFRCQQMQETQLQFPPEGHFSKLRGNLGIVSSEIMAEIHKKS